MSVMRYDSLQEDALTTKAVYKDDGSIEARSIITSIGVFSYKRKDGTIQRELRLPEVVFDEAFIETVKNLPIYVGHQMNADGSFITDPVKRNAITVGYTDKSPVGNNVYLSSGIKINRQDGLEAVNKGIRAFSVGYAAEVEYKSGVWCGQEYDAVQTKLRADHLALVSGGRQGDQAVLRVDSDDAILCEDATLDVAEDIKSDKGDEMANMKTVVLDGISYDAEETVVQKLNESVAKLDTATKEIAEAMVQKSTIEAERDSYKARVDSLDAKVKELEASRVDEAVIDAKVKEKLELLKTASMAKVDVADGMSDLDIKKAIIMAKHENAKLDGKDETYINTRIDCIREDMAAELHAQADASVRSAGAVAPAPKLDAGDAVAKAKSAYLERMSTPYFGKKK